MLLKPDIKLEKVTDITVGILNKYNINALILDVDNTLSTHHGQVLTDGLEEWLAYMKENGISLSVLSNSKEARVKPFAEKINLEYISLGLKPLPFGFLRVLKKHKLNRKKTAIVGDQIFTDVLGGNAVGLNTILLTPIQLETTAGFKFKRKIERLVFKIYGIKNTEE